MPHNQRHAALHAMISRLRDHKEIIVVTPDGPRGPKYVVKPGIVMAAKATGAHWCPSSWTASKHWELGTWDAMKIPKPFSKIVVTFGEAIVLGEEVKEEVALEVLQRRWLNLIFKGRTQGAEGQGHRGEVFSGIFNRQDLQKDYSKDGMIG